MFTLDDLLSLAEGFVCLSFGSGCLVLVVVLFLSVLFPVDVEQHELMQAESLHVIVVDDVQAEVEQVLGIAFE